MDKHRMNQLISHLIKNEMKYDILNFNKPQNVEGCVKVCESFKEYTHARKRILTSYHKTQIICATLSLYIKQ